MNYIDLLNQPKMTLIASLPGNRPELAQAAWECGADVVKVHMNVQHRASGLHFGSFEEEKQNLLQILEQAKGPCGIVAGGCIEAALRDYRAAVNAGFSFISLYARDMSLDILADPDLYKMVAFAPGYTLEDVRNLGKIGGDVLEASVMQPESYGTPMSVLELLEYTSICENSPLPVVVPTQRAVKPREVSQLAACGVAGLMVGAMVTGKELDAFRNSITAFRNAIDAGLS